MPCQGFSHDLRLTKCVECSEAHTSNAVISTLSFRHLSVISHCCQNVPSASHHLKIGLAPEPIGRLFTPKNLREEPQWGIDHSALSARSLSRLRHQRTELQLDELAPLVNGNMQLQSRSRGVTQLELAKLIADGLGQDFPAGHQHDRNSVERVRWMRTESQLADHIHPSRAPLRFQPNIHRVIPGLVERVSHARSSGASSRQSGLLEAIEHQAAG